MTDRVIDERRAISSTIPARFYEAQPSWIVLDSCGGASVISEKERNREAN
jgi:hypothetical protein